MDGGMLDICQNRLKVLIRRRLPDKGIERIGRICFPWISRASLSSGHALDEAGPGQLGYLPISLAVGDRSQGGDISNCSQGIRKVPEKSQTASGQDSRSRGPAEGRVTRRVPKVIVTARKGASRSVSRLKLTDQENHEHLLYKAKQAEGRGESRRAGGRAGRRRRRV